ncbi:50S ribosomal protein L16 3-hydroxylase [Parasphingorhabdus marina DSM 22363]|uniref:50S ribosomal protein L16 3-hydroxylase n=1 Tax=Parasphingorhabdus marina DSM 22363 TaxID=1123272 RepID=A0A1N6DAN9_9SPHN|nr:cupin domain-containing protein [Parasphingorhabdus marina]SIN67860.1 50S ribosomal protein L16 3-hydroxylase [Parasphingorhabdus marina DSM 22363]
MKLSNFDIPAFVQDHWQKKPLMIPNPWEAWRNPLSADELAGLACEEEVESRLVTSGAEGRETGWALEHGPIPEQRFSTLGESDWTLLVQAVDQYVPEVAALIEPFRFIPDWRIDDIMVSYAADGGGVGPHFDQYDVFLIQGAGQRRWQIGQACDEETLLLPHDDLRLLAEFEPQEEWICGPGDILYLPPGIAHNGTAVGDDCLTYSIGFRAPSTSELIGYWSDDMLADLVKDARFADPDLMLQENPGEIRAEALDRMHEMIRSRFDDRDAFRRWFGQYGSIPKYAEHVDAPNTEQSETDIAARLDAGSRLFRNPSSRFLFVRKGDNSLTLFANGHSHDCSGARARFAEQLCAVPAGQGTIEPGPDENILSLVTALVNQGSLVFWDDQD